MKNKRTVYDRVNSLDRLAPYVLFLSSYLPLFILIAIKEGAKVGIDVFLLRIESELSLRSEILKDELKMEVLRL